MQPRDIEELEISVTDTTMSDAEFVVVMTTVDETKLILTDDYVVEQIEAEDFPDVNCFT